MDTIRTAAASLNGMPRMPERSIRSPSRDGAVHPTTMRETLFCPQSDEETWTVAYP